MKQKDFKNLPQFIFTQFLNNDNSNLLNYKKDDKWVNLSSFEFLEKSIYFALALKESGVKKGSKFAIYSYQNPTWLIADFSALMIGAVTVPIFHNISKENLLFQLKDCNVKALFVDNQEDFVEKNHFDKLRFVAKELPKNIKNVICNDCKIKKSSANITYFDEMIAEGRDIFAKKELGELRNFVLKNSLKKIFDSLGLVDCNKDDLATIVYTSGSTGNPKGVELSHDNLVFQIKGAAKCFDLNKSDRALSFLPLAHIFERMVMMFYILRSVKIYFVDDVAKIGNNMIDVEPTVMTVVPRLLEKLFAKIKEKSNQGGLIKKIIARKALNRALNKGVGSVKGIGDVIFEKMVYKKYQFALGGKMKLMICGGASLSKDMERFYRNIGINLNCGYGLTETSPVLAVNFNDNYKFSTVGKVFPGVKLKIAKDGELLAKGRGVMMGYHQNIKKTEQVLSLGWLRTGDLAQIDDDGYIKITGRKKELFKTSAGKYVMPIPIEQKLVQEISFLTGSLIIAEGRNFVSAILFPDFEMTKAFKDSWKFKGEVGVFLKSKALQSFISKKIEEINMDLDRSNQILQFRIASRSISVASGEITPSMKLKRESLERNFKDLIDDIY